MATQPRSPLRLWPVLECATGDALVIWENLLAFGSCTRVGIGDELVKSICK